MKIAKVQVLKWTMFNTIKEAIFKAHGYVFGGAVRDMVLRTHACNKFYEAGGKQGDYDNVEILPEYSDRILIPSDLDIVFYIPDDITAFQVCLNLNDMTIDRIDNAVPNPEYGVPDDFTHAKYRISYRVAKALTSFLPVFYVDIISFNKMHKGVCPIVSLPPFGRADFECNALVLLRSTATEIMTLNTTILGPSAPTDAVGRQLETSRIVSDIVIKRGIFVHDKHVPYRVAKMINKGFNLESKNVSALLESNDNTLCALCGEPMRVSYVRMRRCESMCNYHPYCLRTVMSRHDSCPCCKVVVHLTPVDVAFVSSLENCDLALAP